MPKFIEVNCKCGKTFKRQKFSVEKNIKRNGIYLCKSCSSYKRNSNLEYILKLKYYHGEKHWLFGTPKEKNPNYGKKRPNSSKNISLSLKRMTDNGKTVAQMAAEKAAITMKKNGTYIINSKKAAITKEKNNTWVTYHTKPYKGKYYRSQTELDFIKKCEENNITIDNCRFTIKYLFDDKIKNYCPDFYDIKNNIIYEIKSTYTLGLCNKKLLKNNIVKFNTAESLGYNFILVLYEENKLGKIILKKHRYSEPKFYTIKEINEKWN